MQPFLQIIRPLGKNDLRWNFNPSFYSLKLEVNKLFIGEQKPFSIDSFFPVPFFSDKPSFNLPEHLHR
jgi:hypothetical protein